MLVCCNVTGVNAFFVQNEYLPRFADVPKRQKIYLSEPPISFLNDGSALSFKTIEQML